MSQFKQLLKQCNYRFRRWYPFWFYLLNRRSRRQYRKQYVTLEPLEQKLVGRLRLDGLVVTHLDELFPNVNWLMRLQNLVTTKRPSALPQPSKPFLLQLWDSRSGVLDFGNVFLSLALDQKILRIVNEYLGLCCHFDLYEGSITLPIKNNNEPQASQRWHRDPEDPKMCKVFVYLNDVTESSGPFHYLLGSHRGGKYGKLFLPRSAAGRYPDGGAVEARVSSADIKVCTGRAGTVIFCDTAGLHRGGYATNGERWMMTAGYSSPAILKPRHYRKLESFEEQKLGPLASLALDY